MRKPTPYNADVERAKFQRYYADPEKRRRFNARNRVRMAVKRGTLARQPCEVCGAAAVEAHHDDYSQPLKVRWLCRPHHRAHHAAERASASA